MVLAGDEPTSSWYQRSENNHGSLMWCGNFFPILAIKAETRHLMTLVFRSFDSNATGFQHLQLGLEITSAPNSHNFLVTRLLLRSLSTFESFFWNILYIFLTMFSLDAMKSQNGSFFFSFWNKKNDIDHISWKYRVEPVPWMVAFRWLARLPRDGEVLGSVSD